MSKKIYIGLAFVAVGAIGYYFYRLYMAKKSEAESAVSVDTYDPTFDPALNSVSSVNGTPLSAVDDNSSILLQSSGDATDLSATIAELRDSTAAQLSDALDAAKAANLIGAASNSQSATVTVL